MKNTRLSLQYMLFCWMIALIPASLFGQAPPIKWNEFTEEELAMDSFPSDSNASAVILCDFGELLVNVEQNMVTLKTHIRIKILSEAGYSKGTITLPYYKDNDIYDVKAQTIYIDENGNKQVERLGRRDFFRENINSDFKKLSFTLKALKPGAIIEYVYTYRSQNLLTLPKWSFQSDEPTLWSELRAKIPEVLTYVYYFGGTPLPNAIDEQTKALSASRSYDDNVIRWAKKDIPAIRKEPFMTSLKDQFSRIEFQLSSVAQFGYSPKTIMSTWEEFTKELIEDPQWGKQIGRHKEINNKALELANGLTTEEEKLEAIYDFVRKNITWNGEYAGYPDRSLDRAFASGSVSVAEQVLILTSMYRAIGFESHPILTRSRDEGRVIEVYPIINQFDYMLTYLNTGDSDYILDATDANRPYTLLPLRALNERGWLLDANFPQWVNIVHKQKYKQTGVANLNIDETGAIAGTVELLADEYAGILNRELLEEKGVEKFIKEEILSENFSASIDSMNVSNEEDLTKPLISKVTFSTEQYAQAIGDFIYVNPMVIAAWEESPLKSPQRLFSVDFGFPLSETFTLNLTIPDGYEVEELPENKIIRMNRRAGEFKRLSQANGNIINFVCYFQINKDRFAPTEYQELKSFFDNAVNAFNEQIVLKKKTE